MSLIETPAIPFTHAPHLSTLTISPSQFLHSHPHISHFMTGTLVFQSSAEEDDDQEQEPKILLLRRALTDSYPLSWELPGGSVDPSDGSVLSAAARELWEETSLLVSRFISCLGLLPARFQAPEPQVQEWGIPPTAEEPPLEALIFTTPDDNEKQLPNHAIKLLTFTETDQAWGKITLVAEVRDTSVVKTRPDEHVESAWVTEREVLTGWLEDGGGGQGKRVLGFLSSAVRSQALEAFRLRRERGSI